VILTRRRIRRLPIALRIQQAAHRRVDRGTSGFGPPVSNPEGYHRRNDTLPHGALEEDFPHKKPPFHARPATGKKLTRHDGFQDVMFRLLIERLKSIDKGKRIKSKTISHKSPFQEATGKETSDRSLQRDMAGNAPNGYNAWVTPYITPLTGTRRD
jgi:hypothetical protein